MKRGLRWIGGALVTLVLVALAIWALVASRAEQAAERQREQPVAAPGRARRGPGGEAIIALDPGAQARIGLRVETLAPATLRPETAAFGTLEEDPSQGFTLRAPVPGTLRQAEGRPWPRIGETLADHAVIGAIEPLVAPATRVDLESRLTAARADAAAATADLAAARAGYERARALNAEGKIASDRAVQQAEATMRGQEARLAAATENARLIRESLRAAAGPTGPLPLRLARRGEVVTVFAQPDEAVQSGQALLRVARFDALIARVEVPAGGRIDPRVTTARIVVIGRADHPLRGERIALGASNPRTLGQTILFRVAADGLALRPGEAVTAYLSSPGPPATGVVLPRPAVVRFAAKAWAYVETGAGTFARREVALEQPTDTGWFVTGGFVAGDRVVVAGAQLLLSEELKSQLTIEAD